MLYEREALHHEHRTALSGQALEAALYDFCGQPLQTDWEGDCLTRDFGTASDEENMASSPVPPGFQIIRYDTNHGSTPAQ